jgi:DNA topoisomerase-1
MPLQEWGEIQIINGRFGPYIKTPTANYRLPRGTKADTLTEQQVREIIAKEAESPSQTPRKRTFRKKTAK